MDFEEALVVELSKIPGLDDKIFALNAVEGITPPFVIYSSSEGERQLTLTGWIDSDLINCEIHILANNYAELKNFSKLVLDVIRGFIGKAIGIDGPLIKTLTYEQPNESHEEDFNYYRCSFEVNVRI